MIKELYHYNPNHDPRNGQFTTSKGGAYTQSKEVTYTPTKKKYSEYNKKHVDTTISKDTTISTLSHDPDRTKDTDMFFATHTNLDKQHYMAYFNKPIKDIEGNQCFKYKIDSSLKTDLKVASEDSAAKAFTKLYNENGDFYNFVTDPERMQNYFVDGKYKFKGYRQSRSSLEKIRSGETPSSDDLKVAYRMFNYVIPNDGGGNAAYGRDVAAQREKFFNELKSEGYGAVLDTNDAIYGGYKAQSPVIVFDVEQVIPKEVKQTSIKDKRFSTLAYNVGTIIER